METTTMETMNDKAPREGLAMAVEQARRAVKLAAGRVPASLPQAYAYLLSASALLSMAAAWLPPVPEVGQDRPTGADEGGEAGGGAS